jgi:hypothetical protein
VSKTTTEEARFEMGSDFEEFVQASKAFRGVWETRDE